MTFFPSSKHLSSLAEEQGIQSSLSLSDNPPVYSPHAEAFSHGVLSLEEAYRKCGSHFLFLGTWQISREREVEVFLSPLGELEAFLLQRGADPLQKPILLAQVSKERIMGGINGACTASLASHLKNTPGFFAAAVTFKEEEPYLIFLPRLSGAGERSSSTLELVRSKLLRLTSSSDQDIDSLAEDFQYAWENIPTLTEEFWPLLVSACSSFSAALYSCIEKEEKKLQESRALWDRISHELTENGRASLTKERLRELLSLMRTIFVEKKHREQEKIINPLIDALERIEKKEVKLLLQGKNLRIPHDLVSWQISEQKWIALYTLFAKEYAEVIQEKWDLGAKQFEQLGKLLAATLTSRFFSGTVNQAALLQEPPRVQAACSLPSGTGASSQVEEGLQAFTLPYMSALFFLQESASFRFLADEHMPSAPPLIDSILRKGIEEGKNALARYGEFLSQPLANSSEQIAQAQKPVGIKEWAAFLLQCLVGREDSAWQEFPLKQIGALEPRLLSEDALGERKTLKFFKSYLEKMLKEIEKLAFEKPVGVILTCNENVYVLFIEYKEGKPHFFFFDPQGYSPLNEHDHAYIYYNEHLEYVREFLGKRVLYHPTATKQPSQKDSIQKESCQKASFQEQPNELRAYVFLLPQAQPEGEGSSPVVEISSSEVGDSKGKEPESKISRALSQEALLPCKKELLALLDTQRTALMKNKRFDKAESYLSLALQFLEKTGSLEQQVAMLLEAGGFFLQGIKENPSGEIYAYYQSATNYYSAAYQLAQKGKGILQENALLAWKNLLRVQGLYLENKPHLFTKLKQFYTDKCGVDALKRDYPKEEQKQQLLQEIEKMGDYLGARGCFFPASQFYGLAHGLSKKVPPLKEELRVKGEAMKNLAMQKDLAPQDQEIFHTLLAFSKQDKDTLRSLRKKMEDCLEQPSRASCSISLATQEQATHSYREFLLELFSRCALLLDPQKEHNYALLGLGSLVRKEFCPFSDFELAFLIEEKTLQQGLEEKVSYLPILQTFLEEVYAKLQGLLVSFDEAITTLGQDYARLKKTVEQIKGSSLVQENTFLQALKKQFPVSSEKKYSSNSFLLILIEKLEKQAALDRITPLQMIEKRLEEYALFEKVQAEIRAAEHAQIFSKQEFFLSREKALQQGLEKRISYLSLLQTFLEEVNPKLQDPLVSFDEAVKILAQDYAHLKKAVEHVKATCRSQGDTFIHAIKKKFPLPSASLSSKEKCSGNPFLGTLIEKLVKQAAFDRVTPLQMIEKRLEEYALFEKAQAEIRDAEHAWNFSNRKFFFNLAEFFDLTSRALGETKWSTPGGKHLIPSGFSQDVSNNLLQHCAIPEQFALRQKKEEEDPVQLNVLRSVEFLSGQENLYHTYRKRLQEILDANHGFLRKKYACQGIKDYFKIDFSHLQNPSLIDVKTDLLRFPVLAIEALCLYYGIDTSAHTIEKISSLCQRGIFPKELQQPLQKYLEFAFGLRWRIHLEAGKEEDVHLLQKTDREKIFHAYITLLQPLKKALELWLNELLSFNERSQDIPEVKVQLTTCTREGVFQEETEFYVENLSQLPEGKLSCFFFAEGLLEKAQIEIEQKNFSAAQSYLHEALTLERSPYFLKYLSLLYFSLKEFDQAGELAQEGLKLVQERLPSFLAQLDALAKEKEQLPYVSTNPAEQTEEKQSILLILEDKINKIEKEQEVCQKEEQFLSQLIFLAKEQKVVATVFEEAFLVLEAQEKLADSPFAQEEVLYTTLSVILAQGSAASFMSNSWEKVQNLWLETLFAKGLCGKDLLDLFGATYTRLPKPYRQKLKSTLLTTFSDKLSLMQDFYCEEGYIFSAPAKRAELLRKLKELTQTTCSEEERSLPSIKGTYLSNSYFREEVRQRLFDKEEFRKTIDKGTRPVNEVGGICFKKNAESSGDEYAVFLLNHLVTGQGSPPVELLHVSTLTQKHFLLASQKVEKESLDEFLPKPLEVLSKIDKKQFSQMVLMAILIDPEDGQDKNYIANYTKDSQGEIDTIKIIGIDNDHAFVKPFIQKEPETLLGKLLLPLQEVLFIKTILFCFDQMHDTLHPEVKEAFLKLDILQVLEEWLSGLVAYNQRVVGKLFSIEELNKFLQKEKIEERIVVPFFMHPQYVVYLYDKMTRIQQALLEGDKKHIELLRIANSKVAALYEQELFLSKSPQERFKALTPNAFRIVKGSSFSLASTIQINQYKFKEDILSIEGFKEKNRLPEDSLKALLGLGEAQTLKTRASSSQLAIKACTTPLHEERLKEKKWAEVLSDKLSEELQKFHGWPFFEVNLGSCQALTDALLDEFIQKSQCPIREKIEIEKMDLHGCVSLTDNCLTSLQFCTQLRKLDLSGTNVERVVFGKETPYLEMLNLQDCKKLTFVEVKSPEIKSSEEKSSFKQLSLEGCSALQTLVLDCAQLEALSLKGTPYFLSYRANKTSLSQALFIPFRKAQEESDVKIQAPISATTMDLFLRALHKNHSLKTLLIDTQKEKASSSIKLSQTLHLSRHPSLESLQITCHSLEHILLDELPHLEAFTLTSSSFQKGVSFLLTSLAAQTQLKMIDLSGCSSLKASDLENEITEELLEKLRLPLPILDYRDPINQALFQKIIKAASSQALWGLIIYLCSQGIQTIKDQQGNTLFQLAMKRNDREMQAFLEKVLLLEKIAFGKREWLRYFGDIGVEPPLSLGVLEYLQSPCPIWSGKKVHETHMLTLIPEKVNGKPLTLNSLQDLVKSPKRGGKKTQYGYYNSNVQKEHGFKAPDSSYWILMTKDVLPNTRSNLYEQQLVELNTLAARAPQTKDLGTYQTPKALEAAISILMEYVRSGNRFYTDPEGVNKQWTYTRCKETVYEGKWRVAIGGFAASGLRVSDHAVAYESSGLGGARKCFDF